MEKISNGFFTYKKPDKLDNIYFMEETEKPSVKEVYEKIGEGWYNLRQKPYPPEIHKIKNWKGKILDIGCGNARNFLIFKNSKLFGCDISKKMIETARYFCKKHKIKADFAVADSKDLPFKKKFDYIISTAALHHIQKKDITKVLKQIKNLVKKKVFFSAWSKDWPENRQKPKEVFEPWKHKGKIYYRYYYLYNEKEFIEILKKSGFKLIKNLTKKEGKNICIIAGVA